MLSIPQLQKIYTAEKVLVVLISRVYFKNAETEQVQNFIAEADVDWDLLYRIIRAHHIRSFIYHTIATRGLKVDSGFEARLKKDSLDINVQNLHQLHFTKQLLNDFASLGVKAIPYKGINFGSKYYESISIRESSDIDMLVDRNSVKQMRKYFHENKFVAKADIPDRYLNYALFFFKELAFKTPKDKLNINCSVEIQWRLIDFFLGKFAGFDYFEKQLGNNAIDALKALNPTNDMICMASHHFIREPLTSFKYVIDAACLLKTSAQEIDHEEITKLLKRYNYQNFYGVALLTINDLLGVDISTKPYQTEYKNNKVLLNSCLAFPPLKKVSLPNKANLILIWNRHNLKGKADMALRLFFYAFLPSPYDLNKLNLPLFLLPLVVIFRPFRLLIGFIAKK